MTLVTKCGHKSNWGEALVFCMGAAAFRRSLEGPSARVLWLVVSIGAVITVEETSSGCHHGHAGTSVHCSQKSLRSCSLTFVSSISERWCFVSGSGPYVNRCCLPRDCTCWINAVHNGGLFLSRCTFAVGCVNLLIDCHCSQIYQNCCLLLVNSLKDTLAFVVKGKMLICSCGFNHRSWP